MIENIFLRKINFAYGDSSFFDEIMPYVKSGDPGLIRFGLSDFHLWFPVFEKNIDDLSYVQFAVKIPDKPEPMIQFMGFLFYSSLTAKLSSFEMPDGRTKENYMKFQTLMIEEDFEDYAFIDATFINELDKLYDFTLKL